MATRITMMLVLAAACAANIGCACTNGYYPFGGASRGGSCPSCGMAEASGCCAEDASCGLPEASCCVPEVASCGLPEASCCLPEDASCGLPTGGCDTCTTSVGCGSPVVGNCRFLQRICDAFRGRSYYNSGCSSESYWSEWHNDPPCDCPSCSPQASVGGRGEYYSSANRRSSRPGKRNIDFGEELRFAEQESETSYR